MSASTRATAGANCWSCRQPPGRTTTSRLFAAKGPDGNSGGIRSTASPLQSEPASYGSLFSRAKEIRAGDEEAWAAHCRKAGLQDLPIVLTRNTVCRDDLLFEIEEDAVAEE